MLLGDNPVSFTKLSSFELLPLFGNFINFDAGR